MAPKSIFQNIALLLSLFAFPHNAGAQDAQGKAESAGGFRTDRLSPRQVRMWNSIRKIAFATDRQGRPLRPTLQTLWSTVEQSNHLVFVELVTNPERCSNIAAETVVEEPDPAGRKHIIRLRLFIPAIDRAYPGVQESQEGMQFVPFAGLSHETRYAKVLGHELAHVSNMLRDPGYLRLVQEICAEQHAIAAEAGSHGEGFSRTDLQERSNRIWQLVLESERPALAAEAVIYRELLAGR